MQISKSTLKQLIKEELGAVLTEKSTQRGENDLVDLVLMLANRLETLELSVKEIEKQQTTIIGVLNKMIRGGEKR